MRVLFRTADEVCLKKVVGDSLQIKSNPHITGPYVIFSMDRTQGEVSLRHLGQELEPHAAEVRFIATDHTGTVAGLEPLLSFGGS